MANLVESKISYIDPSAFIFDTDKIEISGDKAKLKLIPLFGRNFSQTFDSDAGFTYDNTKAEVVGGELKQKPVVVANENLYAAPFDNSGIATRAIGTKNVTLAGGASVVDYNSKKYYNVSGLVNGKYVAFNADNAQYGGVGTFRFKIVPQYSGNAAGIVDIFTVSGNADANRVGIYHNGSDLYIVIVRDTGITQGLANIGAWSPVAGQEYEFELNVNIPASVTSLSINGILKGSSAASPAFTSTITKLQLGRDDGKSNYYFRDLEVFSVVKHTANFPEEIPRTILNYYGSKIDIPPFSYTGVGSIIAVEDSEVLEAGSPRFTVAGLYWNGSAWAISNGTYAQASTSAQIVTNLPALNVSGAEFVPVSIFFNDSISISSVDLISITVTGQTFPTDNPSIESKTHFNMATLESFDALEVKGGLDEIRYQLRIGGVLHYISAGEAITSNGSYAESNTLEEIKDVLENAPVDIDPDSEVFIVALLHSETGLTFPEIEWVSAGFNYYYAGDSVNYCIVTGKIVDNSGLPVAGATIEFDSKKDYIYGENFVSRKSTFTTGADGKFLARLLETVSTGKTLICTIKYTEDDVEKTIVYKNLVIPALLSKTLSEIISDSLA